MNQGPRLKLVPCSLKAARAYVDQHHRHHDPPAGHKFSLQVKDESGAIRGVCIVGRPVARGNDDGLTLEVTRVATDGCPNACSKLYAAAGRAAKALGYTRLITYTLESEPGTSLIAAGWVLDGHVKGRSWDTPSRRRNDHHPLVSKTRWAAQ